MREPSPPWNLLPIIFTALELECSMEPRGLVFSHHGRFVSAFSFNRFILVCYYKIFSKDMSPIDKDIDMPVTWQV
jgi:hypothetical protein